MSVFCEGVKILIILEYVLSTRKKLKKDPETEVDYHKPTQQGS
jgi:hypothetical protein